VPVVAGQVINREDGSGMIIERPPKTSFEKFSLRTMFLIVTVIAVLLAAMRL
jgi:hypothetical protein